jgi:hypothetical protein
VVLTGTVTSNEIGRLEGATLDILDGPNAGRSTRTNISGDYRFEGLTQGNGNLRATADGHAEARAGVFINGTNTLNFTLTVTGPRTIFGPGQWRVGPDIAPGRYFANPVEGCVWELYGPTRNLTANERVTYDAGQIIVDIQSSMTAFHTNAMCGGWSMSPHGGEMSSIPPGVWLVNRQVRPGDYVTEAAAGCYWERLDGFRGDSGDVVENGFVSSADDVAVRISSGDEGFRTTEECGEWEPSSSSSTSRAPSQPRSEIERNRALGRRGR